MSAPRLAYLLKKFPRLSETFVLGEILAQERLGREVHVFSRRPIDDEPRHPALEELRATIETLPSRSEMDPWKALFSDAWDPREVFARVGDLVSSSRQWKHPRFSSLLNEALHLLRRTEELGIEHVHAHFATDSAVVAMLLKGLGGPTYSITAHAKDIYRSSVNPDMLNRLFEDSSFVVTVCDANVRFLEEKLSSSAIEQVRRLYNGIDLTQFPLSLEGRDVAHVLAVGRIVEKKGFLTLVEAARLLLAEGRDLRVTIVGTGDQEESLRTRIAQEGLSDRIHMAGALDQSQVRDLMDRATVLCQPCVIGEDGNRDALPTVLLEALASGLPTVSTPVTGIPEILDGGRTGLIVPERDARATAVALSGLLDDAERRCEIAVAGRARAERLFDRETNARVLHAWFDEALARGGRPCALPA